MGDDCPGLVTSDGEGVSVNDRAWEGVGICPSRVVTVWGHSAALLPSQIVDIRAFAADVEIEIFADAAVAFFGNGYQASEAVLIHSSVSEVAMVGFDDVRVENVMVQVSDRPLLDGTVMVYVAINGDRLRCRLRLTA